MIDRWRRKKIAVWGRRRGRPFNRVGFPWIVLRFLTFEDAVENIKQKDELNESKCKGAHGDENVHPLKLLQKFILHRVVDPAHVAAHAENMHREKRAVERDKG